MFQSALLLIFPAAMAFAAATDLLTFRIPNAISLTMFAAFFVIAPFSSLTFAGFLAHLATFAAVLAVAIALNVFGLFGGGDAKLLSVASLWVGYEHLPSYIFMTAICGGVLALVLITFRRFALPQFALRHAWIEQLHSRKSDIPYGLALAAAALWIYPSTKIFTGVVS